MNFLKRYYIVYLLIFAFVASGGALISRAMNAVAPVLAESAAVSTVIIDPGHGGEDGGASSTDGTREADLNLEISLRLSDLCGLLGIPTRMVRTEDIAIYSDGAKTISQKKVSDLKNRVALVNGTPKGILVSIHQNMYSDAKYFGPQVFYATTAGSKEFAVDMQQRLNASLVPDSHREAKQATTVYLLKEIKTPGILVECGFLSNKEEKQKLCTAEYQKKLACVIAAGIYAYLTEDGTENEV